jgi:indolepyruvate ferredoxin oxidoreductase
LDDPFRLEAAPVFVTGVQAIALLALLRVRADRASGRHTAGFVSGYRGSPVAGLDRVLWRAKEHLVACDVVFQPGVNEELAATAVWGSQQLHLRPGAKFDGVVGLWYGKGPGVDRCGDVFKHANFAGTAPLGGVLVVAGDDHAAESSSLPWQSDFSLRAALIPVLCPANVADLITLGMHGYGMSRYAGLWVGLKSPASVVDGSATLHLPAAADFAVAPVEAVAAPRWPEPALAQERRMFEQRIPAVLAYARAHGLNPLIWPTPGARLGLVGVGKSYTDLREALRMLDVDEVEATRLGVRLIKIELSWPLEPDAMLRFAAGLDEILVVEEKRPLVEPQLKELLYTLPRRPRVAGKWQSGGCGDAPWLFSPLSEHNPVGVAHILVRRIAQLPGAAQFIERTRRLPLEPRSTSSDPSARSPFYCAGCPHNRSTRLPEGSHSTAGIGCHYMAMWIYPEQTLPVSQMGGEGAAWIGQAPFTKTDHSFANLGDGTYFHSGLLAIRAALAARVNITYKILYNDAVAMTGGQAVDGYLSVPRLTRQLAAEGVARIVIVAEQPEKYRYELDLAPAVQVRPRDELDAVQRELRDHPGVTALIYDQTCAAEKRRRRKRGALADAPRRVFINERVCEGCGDCGVKSNCVAIVPVETEYGRKRQIDQSSCNKDLSCINGFCPSFVTLEGARPRSAAIDWRPPEIPEPALPPLGERPYEILITGIGGSGITTLSALLGMAAHLQSAAATVQDMVGLAQKNGAVTSHVKLATRAAALFALPVLRADVLIACDLPVAASENNLARLDIGRSRAVVNLAAIYPGGFTREPDFKFDIAALHTKLQAHLLAGGCQALDAAALCRDAFGDAGVQNVLLLGLAYQTGLLPLRRDALRRAIELNGIAVEQNLRAFELGRLAAHDRAAVDKMLPAKIIAFRGQAARLDELVEARAAELRVYQNDAYALRYRRLVERVCAAEAALGWESLTRAVAESYFKLLAYKDEYEVARLYSDASFAQALNAAFEPGFTKYVYFASPILSRAGTEAKKRRFGAWIWPALRVLAGFKFLRGSRLDPFAYHPDRRAERALIVSFETSLQNILLGLRADNHAIALAYVRSIDLIRGYGAVKRRAIEAWQQRQAELLAHFHAPQPNNERRAA